MLPYVQKSIQILLVDWLEPSKAFVFRDRPSTTVMVNPSAEWFSDARNDGSLFKLVCDIVGGKRTASRVAMDIEKTLASANLVSLQLQYIIYMIG